MRKFRKKATALALLTGTLFGGLFGGCLGNPWALVRDAAIYVGMEYVLDSDGVFDLFEDGAVVE